MNRQIKFRVWHKASKNFIPDPWNYYLKLDGNILYDCGQYNPDLIEVNGRIIQQFTGLFDKTGKEIYEGDIIKNHFGEYTISFKNGAFTANGIALNHIFVVEDKTQRINEVKVIGNILENSKILK